MKHKRKRERAKRSKTNLF